MSRPLRIEYPGAWYHVMNRGRRSEAIFGGGADYALFTDLIRETVEKWQMRVSAYCLMPNHYHLLVQTPQGNLSRCMRHLNGVYTQRFNRRHGFDGQLFRGRYKCILVEADSYLLQLVRYIHRNPIRAGLAENLVGYPWSSHKGYLSRAKKWDWLHKDFILDMLSGQPSGRMAAYRQFMNQEDSETICGIYARRRWPAWMGSDAFIQWVKATFHSEKSSGDVPQAKALAPDPERIIRAVCDYYGISEEALMRSRRGVFNEPRNVAIFLMRQLRVDSLSQIGALFQMKTYSSVSSVVERMRSLSQADGKLRRRIRELRTAINSQEQT